MGKLQPRMGRWVCGLLAALFAACAAAQGDLPVAKASIVSTGSQPDDAERSLYFPGRTVFRVELTNLVPGRTYHGRAIAEEPGPNLLQAKDFSFVATQARETLTLLDFDTSTATPGTWRFVLRLLGDDFGTYTMQARLRPRPPAEQYPPLKLVRAVITPSISRNAEPRRPLETLRLPSAVFYYVEAEGFLPGKNYQVRVVILDGAEKLVGEHHFATYPRSARDVVWFPVTPRATDTPGRWTFRMYLGASAPASQLVAETRIEAGATGGRAKDAGLERFAPAVGLALLGLLAYLACNMRRYARATPAVAPAAPGRGIAPLIVLIAVNLLPLGFVHFAGANAADLLVLYWFENLVVALYTLLRMASARGPGAKDASPLLYVPFFLLSFGLFSGVHASIVLYYAWEHSSLFALNPRVMLDAPVAARFEAAGRELWDVLPFVLVLQVTALLISHGISFVSHYLKGGEYLTSTPQKEMMRPYPRIMVMHVAAVGSGLFVSSQGSPLAMLVLLVLLKTGVDAYSHVRSHGAAGGKGYFSPPPP